jgi:hypothetical protein
MQKKEQIFLGKNGKIFGPYHQRDYDQMLSNGSLMNFTWIWDWKASNWQLLEMPPALITEDLNSLERDIPIQAVCFNKKHIISGRLDMITENGCILVAENNNDKRSFSAKSSIEVNLYNLKSKKSVTIDASISSMDYKNRRWIYCIKWDECPNIL